MTTVLLVVQLFICIALIGLILIQRSEGGGLGIGGGGGGGGVMSGRSAANTVTRATTILGALFILNSIALAGFYGSKTQRNAEEAVANEGQGAIDRQEQSVGDVTDEDMDMFISDDAETADPETSVDETGEDVSTDPESSEGETPSEDNPQDEN